jgi:DNA transposition AAA+ family ATPase
MSEVIRLTSSSPANKPEHCPLTAYRELHDLFTTCRRTQQIGVAVGPTGSGKTTAAKAYAADWRNNAAYLRINTTINAGQPFLNKLCAAVRAYPPQGSSKADFLDAVKERVVQSYGVGLIILDEMNHGSGEILHLIRDLWDEARCGVVLLGTPEMENLWARRAKSKSDPFEAFRDRIGQRLDIARPDNDDVSALCRHYDLIGKRERDLVAASMRKWNGLHGFDRLMENARQLAGEGKPVTAQHLIDAAELTGAL